MRSAGQSHQAPVPPGEGQEPRDVVFRKPHPYDPRRGAGDDRIVGHVAGDDGARAHDHAMAEAGGRRQHRLTAKPAIIADDDVAPARRRGAIPTQPRAVENGERVGRKAVHRVIGRRGDELDPFGDLAEPPDRQPLRRAGKEIGRQRRGVVLRKTPVVVIGVVAHIDVGMVEHGGQKDRGGVARPVRQDQRRARAGVGKGGHDHPSPPPLAGSPARVAGAAASAAAKPGAARRAA